MGRFATSETCAVVVRHAVPRAWVGWPLLSGDESPHASIKNDPPMTPTNTVLRLDILATDSRDLLR
jgi:hypothetical protein